jgi:hypothetical protein
MKQPPTKERPTSVDRLSEFTWRVYRGGYTWLTAREPELYVLSSGVDEQIEARDADSYEPTKVEPGLFRAFANLPPTRKNIRDFANRYGRLGGFAESAEYWSIPRDPGQPELLCRAEPFRFWVSEILLMRAIVDLWIAVQARDEQTIKKHIRWDKGVARFQSGPDAASLGLPRPPMPESERVSLSPLPWSAELDNAARSLRIHGWVVHPKRDGPNFLGSLPEDWIETALYFIEVVVNRKLIEHSIERPRLQWVGHEQLAWQHEPSSLIGLLWLQFADAIATNRNFKQCAQCQRWFEIAQNLARTDKVYCSPTCRVRAYRTRQAQVRELYSLGSTVDDLAGRFGSDPKTIKAWLSQGRGHK